MVASGGAVDGDVYVYDTGPDATFGTADDGGESPVDIPTEEPDDFDLDGDRLDGDRLVFEDFRAGSGEIFVYDLATQTETQLIGAPSPSAGAR